MSDNNSNNHNRLPNLLAITIVAKQLKRSRQSIHNLCRKLLINKLNINGNHLVNTVNRTTYKHYITKESYQKIKDYYMQKGKLNILCVYCKSPNIIKKGYLCLVLKQRYYCKDCKKVFSRETANNLLSEKPENL